MVTIMKQSQKTKSRIYVCHTFYHVYVAILKEMKLQREDANYQKGDIALSEISTNFENLAERLEKAENHAFSLKCPWFAT